ncbi:MAG: DUF1015 domain-containing protein [Bacillota bacterium]
MAGIIPIRGWRYGASIQDLAAVITPPYDVIDREAQESFYARHPNNIIRLEYGVVLPGDDDANNRYTRAAEFFKNWCREGILQRDAKPAFYFYEQAFTLGDRRHTRRGFLCGLELEPYGRNVMPHEDTLSAAKADRARLIHTCEANFSPIFALYSDPKQIVEQLFINVHGSMPACDFTDEEGQTHRLWAVTDGDTIEATTALLAGCRVLIADGHHRFETALHYCVQRRPKGNSPEKAPYCFILTFLVNTYDPGLVILPTHRLVKTPADFHLDRFLAAAAEFFVVTESQGEIPLPDHRYAFGLYAGNDRGFYLTLKEGLDPADLLEGAKPPTWKRSAVAVLHALVLDRYLKIGPGECTAGERIAYNHNPAEAAMLVNNAVWDLAFFLYPAGIDELVTVAEAGEKMPQKSTYFYPKVPTGLVIYSFAE